MSQKLRILGFLGITSIVGIGIVMYINKKGRAHCKLLTGKDAYDELQSVYGTEDDKNHNKKLITPEELEDGQRKPTDFKIANKTDRRVTLCWIEQNGVLHHFNRILGEGYILDGSVSSIHVEHTFLGDSFVCFIKNKSRKELPKLANEIHQDEIICIYTPTKLIENGIIPHELNLISSNAKSNALKITAELPKKSNLRGSEQPIKYSGQVIDSKDKEYLKKDIYGFIVYYEPEVFEKHEGLLEALEEDLKVVDDIFPPKALEFTKTKTPIWLNHTLSYGPVEEPINGCACYYPINNHDYLSNNGLNPVKAGSVEIHNAKSYLSDRGLWQPGGMLAHEYSHAYHCGFIDNGFSNKDILNTFESAMDAELYDNVDCHGPQGLNGPQRAYACYNAMEYFAETSVAFFGKNSDIEYNKWFPFNSTQLQEHDKKCYEMHSRIWV